MQCVRVFEIEAAKAHHSPPLIRCLMDARSFGISTLLMPGLGCTGGSQRPEWTPR